MEGGAGWIQVRVVLKEKVRNNLKSVPSLSATIVIRNVATKLGGFVTGEAQSRVENRSRQWDVRNTTLAQNSSNKSFIHFQFYCETSIPLTMGLKTFLSESHISYYTTVENRTIYAM